MPSAFRRAGADLMTIHIEAVPEPRPLLAADPRLGGGGRICAQSAHARGAVEAYLDDCDLVLVMSVMPGFGGQKFEPVALEKFRRLRAVGRPRVAAFGRRRSECRQRSALCRGRRRYVGRPARRCSRITITPDDHRLTDLARIDLTRTGSGEGIAA